MASSPAGTGVRSGCLAIRQKKRSDSRSPSLFRPDRLEEEPKIIARLKKGERVDHFETVRARKDGSLIDISLTISPDTATPAAKSSGPQSRQRHHRNKKMPWLSCAGQTPYSNNLRTQRATTCRNHCVP